MSTPNGMDRESLRNSRQLPYQPESSTPTETHHAGQEPDGGAHGAHGGHGLMMIVCCIPMLAIAGLLFLTGVAGSGIIVTALLCTAMMAAMMFAMPGGHGGHGHK
ncbi:hypothetical protein [Nocardioides oceani]|jgi:hypothetical protein|uniref:DUF2933 domain-containing protein n=1 Tax=Nocardioides oceani TaxID=3058369 RepID=A0ABT8FMG9_9ACTN|nr:hypothetical protein [Nocardioides oceani]MDN4175706.1 hypothetical protein [Nocardioides oceani]|tara:strand:- start:874 stop:1188 length:315 start_codon:yes stop_codon:yes gene_type:complete